MTPSAGLTGLSAAEVAERTAQGWTNRVRRSDVAEYADIVSRNVFTLFNALVVPAAVILLVLRDFKAGLAVSGMMIANTLLGLVQEIRAKWHLDHLTLLAEARVRVVRDGKVSEVPSGDVVQGDVLLLTAGDGVVADGEVLEARFLEVDEALLTGESDPVPRKPGDQLLSGSFCVTGEGAYRADQVGLASFAQKTAAEARAYRYTASPLQEVLNRVINVLTIVAILMAASYVARHYLLGHSEESFGALVRMIAATITSMVPQGLVLMATLAFVLGAVRMTTQGAIVNRLNAVEAMAAIDVLCMDKTGTLTTNRLQLAQVRVLPGAADEEGVKRRLRLFASCSLDQSNKNLAAIRATLGEAKGELVDQLPFKSQNRYSAVRVRGEGCEFALVMGACEALGPLTEPRHWEAAWKELLGSGLRVLMFAEVESAPRPTFDGSLEGHQLKALALVALSDELRPEAADVLRHLAGQGIGFKILSGDNAETVRATVTPLGQNTDCEPLAALAGKPVVSGAELEAAANAEEVIRDRTVFGRVSPWQKVQIVQTLKGQGRHVAMIGDGVNDVLPIKNAHLGIAMGDGSRASKTVSGIVLRTNDFELLPRTLEEGRTIVRNLCRASKLFLTKNVFTFLLVVLGMYVFGLPFPFVPQQVTLLNFVTIGIPALLITLDRTPTTGGARAGYIRDVGRFVLWTGLISALAALGLMLVSKWVWYDGERDDFERMQRTLGLSVLVLLGMVTLWRSLAAGKGGGGGAPWLRWLPVAMPPVYLAAMYLPAGQQFFELVPLDLYRWGWVLLISGVGALAMWLTDRLEAGGNA